LDVSHKMKSGLDKLKANYKLWLSLENGEGILGDGKWLLLRTIEETGSISKAAEKLDISYRKAWGDLRKIEQMLAVAVIDKQRGGTEGGRTILTPVGILLIRAYSRFHDDFEQSFQKSFKQFKKEIISQLQ
jgi:molybdate transport system regulatory protein